MPTISQSRRQAKILNDGFLDLLGDGKLDYAPLDLDAVAGTLADFAIRFIETAREKLQASDRIATSRLADSIVPTEVKIFGSIYQIEIKLASYYKFVDEGVKGWQNERGGNSPYSFKRTRPSKKMETEIRKWVIREGLKGRGRENKKSVGLRDRRRNKISDTSTSTAFAIAASIKKKGLKPSHFWTDTAKEMERKMADELGKALKIDIINAIVK